MATAKRAHAGAAGGSVGPTLDALIAAKEKEITDGNIQVIMAIASVTTVVTIDTTQTPPIVDPAGLGGMTFAAVGMSDPQVAIFKANLQVMLPRIATDIAQIPDNANLLIADVARFVRLSLLAAS